MTRFTSPRCNSGYSDVKNHVNAAMTQWLELGLELAKPHYADLLETLMKGCPYLYNGNYRAQLLSGMATHPALALGNLSRVTTEVPNC